MYMKMVIFLMVFGYALYIYVTRYKMIKSNVSFHIVFYNFDFTAIILRIHIIKNILYF